METGMVRMVTTIEAGCVVDNDHTGGALSSWDGGDLNPNGGVLTPDDGRTLLAYTGFVVESYDSIDGETTDDYWEILLADGAPIDEVTWDESGETWMQEWPPRVDMVADVLLSDGDDAQAVVPHSLRAVMADGVREEDTGETVNIDFVDGQWTIVDIIGRKATIVGSAIDEQTKIEIASASGANRNTYSTRAPEGDGDKPGDAWFQLADGHTIGMWHWDGSAWRKDVIDGTSIANLDAGTIVSGSLSGIDIYSPSPEETPRVHIGSSTLQVVRSDGEDGEMATITLGGPADDQMMLYGADGEPAAGFTADGGGVATSFDVADTLTIGGEDLMGMLARLPRGIIARRHFADNSPIANLQFGDTELGIWEFAFDMQADRLYRFGIASRLWTSAAMPLVLRLRWEVGGSPSTPTIGSTAVDVGVLQIPSRGAGYVEWSSMLPPAVQDMSCRLLLTAQSAAKGEYGYFFSSDVNTSNMWVEDMGTYLSDADGQSNAGGGKPYRGSAPAPTPSTPPEKQYTSSWNAAGIRSWRGAAYTTDYLQQGYYGGHARYSVILWDDSIAAALAHSHVQSMKVFLKNVYWYGGKGRARIGMYRGTGGVPGSPQTSGGSAFWSPEWNSGAGKWVDLPRSWWGPIARGEVHGITLGEGVGGTTTGAYGKFAYANYQCILKVTYTK